MVTLSGAGHKVTLEAHTKRVAHEGSPIALPTPLLQRDVGVGVGVGVGVLSLERRGEKARVTVLGIPQLL